MILDCETNGLKPTKIWCCVIKHEGHHHVFTDGSTLQEFLNENTEERIYAHNGLSYDYPVLERLWGIDWSNSDLRDTLVLARLYNPSLVGGHSLGAWGQRLGYPKGEYSDWSQYTPEMLTYCKQDCDVTERLLAKVGDPEVYAVELEGKVQKIISQQIDNGWLLDEQKCWMLLGELKERKHTLEDQVHVKFKPLATFIKEVIPKKKKDGTYSIVGLKAYGEDALMVVGGSYSSIDFPNFNLGSRQQIGRYLQYFGWEPCVFTETGLPKVDETVLEGVNIPEAQMIAEYLMVEKRIAMITSWLEAAGEDGRVHGYVNPIGAVTSRMTHSSPNVAQVTAKGKPYGASMRECWVVSEGHKLVGMDASGLELRMLAHYMNDDTYTAEVLDGDLHTVNQKAAGLATRDQAKTFIYAFLYGAGDAKIGSIVGGSAADGKRLKAKFLANTPALKSLRERVEKAAGRGWLKGLDGRRINVRHSHAALNTLLQSAGAIIMKEALVLLVDKADSLMLNYKIVGNIHDEIQTEVLAADAEMYATATEWAMEEAGKKLGLRCPLAGESTIGNNWGDTH